MLQSRARSGWRNGGAVALIGLLSGAGASAAMEPQQASEYAVKAAYLYKFAAFVEWPDTAFATPSSPLQICILGDDPFGANLKQAVGDQRVGQRAVEIRRLDRVDRTSGCQILYISASRRQPAADALRLLNGAPVLTVTDAEGQGPQAVIHFAIRNGHVRFGVDATSAAQNHLTLSSKLLGVALSVKSRP
jgi:hypothetical protein